MVYNGRGGIHSSKDNGGKGSDKISPGAEHDEAFIHDILLVYSSPMSPSSVPRDKMLGPGLPMVELLGTFPQPVLPCLWTQRPDRVACNPPNETYLRRYSKVRPSSSRRQASYLSPSMLALFTMACKREEKVIRSCSRYPCLTRENRDTG